MKLNERQTLNGGESEDWIEKMFGHWGPVHYICGVRLSDGKDCRRDLDALNPDDAIPVLSTVTESEIDAALLPLEG